MAHTTYPSNAALVSTQRTERAQTRVRLVNGPSTVAGGVPGRGSLGPVVVTDWQRRACVGDTAVGEGGAVVHQLLHQGDSCRAGLVAEEAFFHVQVCGSVKGSKLNGAIR